MGDALSSSTFPLTGDQRLVKALNRMALLRLLRIEKGLSRADLSDRSGLTRSTVSLLTKELIDEGWIAEDDVQATGALGRRPTPLRLDGRGLVLIGAELTPDTLRVVRTSIHGEVRQATQATLLDRTPDAACHQLVEMVVEQARQAVQAGEQLLGIGVGLPGAVEPSTGLLLFAPNIGWRRVAVGVTLREELRVAGLGHVPVYCQNEADLAAVGETEFGSHPVDDPLVYIGCGVGLGAGIMLGDKLFVGATGAGGEIGHTTLQLDGRLCSCGRLGCAEAYVGLAAIAEACGLRAPDGSIDRSAFKRRIDARDTKVRAAFEAAGRHLGVLLQNVWVTFDPKAVVLGGEAVALGGHMLVDAALDVLGSYAERAGVAAPPVRLARYTELATAVGGAGYALYALMRPHQMSALQG